jgi:hypothetical protein
MRMIAKSPINEGDWPNVGRKYQEWSQAQSQPRFPIGVDGRIHSVLHVATDLLGQGNNVRSVGCARDQKLRSAITRGATA